MNLLPHDCSVLIVGAGPSGLMMAAQLLRYGIQPVIIDSKTGLNQESRALAVQARSLEIFRQLGLDEAALAAGNPVDRLAVYQDAEVAAFSLTEKDKKLTAFPYVLILEQSRTEKVLLSYLTSKACPVYWDTELLDIRSDDRGARVKLKRGETEKEIKCDWVIGADGASGKVRKSQGLSFAGGTYLNRFYLADIVMKDQGDISAVRLFLKKEGFTGIFPVNGQTYRFIGVLPQTLKDRADVTFDDLKPYLTYTLGFPLQGEVCQWFSVYKLHHRLAERFRNKRCFLIGDAAHIHSPVGGQGMNTGLQDAYNLAWKLQGVIKNEFHEKILDSYSEERMGVAKQLLATTDKLFTLSVSGNWFVKQIRRYVLPRLFQWIWKRSGMRFRLFSHISQIALHYRASGMSVHHSRTREIAAGDRLPYLKLFDEKRKEHSDLHAWCSKPGFTLLVIGLISQRDVHLLAKFIKATYPAQLNFYYLPPSSSNQHIFDAFEIKEDHKKAVIVRPDLYIGYMNDVVDIELIDIYLRETIGWRK